MTDFTFANHGSITVLTPVSEEAQAWVDEHIPEDAMTWGVRGIVIEPRYALAILTGIMESGLSVEQV